MGLIKAAMGAAGGVMADQWKEFFYCDALDQDTLIIKGQKRTGARSSNTKGSDNIISNGSGIAVANGQCMMIVEQGKVDEILSNNPVNRRKVFDEACGISKFRYKKQEAERNLKHTKENLERIDDIYIEIENQLKPLFLQQEKAAKYLEFSKKLKVLEVNSCIKEVAELEAELDELNKHSNLLGSQSNEIQKQKSTLEKAVEETNIEIENINDGINKSQDYINTIKSVISQKDAQVNLINEKIRNCKNEIERNKEEIIYIKEKLNSDKITLEKLINQKYEKEKIINDLNIDIKSIESNNKESRDKIETINRDLENNKSFK